MKKIIACSLLLFLALSGCTIVLIPDNLSILPFVVRLQVPSVAAPATNTPVAATPFPSMTPADWLDPTPGHDPTPTQEGGYMPPETPPEEIRPIWFVVDTSVHLNVRSGPGTKYAIVTKLPPGTLVQVRFDGDSFESGGTLIWAYVHDAQGKALGWVAKDYLEDYAA